MKAATERNLAFFLSIRGQEATEKKKIELVYYS